MKGLMRMSFQRTTPTAFISTGKPPPVLAFVDSLPCFASISRKLIISPPLRYREISRLNSAFGTVRAQASNVSFGSGAHEGGEDQYSKKNSVGCPSSDNSAEIAKPPRKIPYLLSIAVVLFGCAVVFSLIAFVKGGPSSVLAAIAKSGLTAAFMLIFVSEIGDKTFFIAALLAMQYDKGLVLLGSMGALSLMTILSVVIGRIFNAVPAQFQTTVPIGEYAAIALLMLFGLKSIKDAWDLPSNEAKSGKQSNPELGELIEAEELVKEKVIFKLGGLTFWSTFQKCIRLVWVYASVVYKEKAHGCAFCMMGPGDCISCLHCSGFIIQNCMTTDCFPCI